MTGSTTRTLIHGGRVITAVDDYCADILVEGERIVCIGQKLQVGTDTRTIDASGMLVFPGGVDCHTHMENTFGQSQTCDNFVTGTRSAAFGSSRPSPARRARQPRRRVSTTAFT